jgi:hypothetical protein
MNLCFVSRAAQIPSRLETASCLADLSRGRVHLKHGMFSSFKEMFVPRHKKLKHETQI